MTSRGDSSHRDVHMPPITVVTTAPSNINLSHKNETTIIPAPTILLKPPQPSNTLNSTNNGNNINNSNAASLSLNRSSHNPNNYNYNNYHYNNQQTFTTNSHTNITEEENDKEIDSALISALRDKRERMALLRLEQNLIDFMNEKNCGFMEVGGPFNNIIIKGASGGGSAAAATGAGSTGAGTGYEDTSGATSTTTDGTSNIITTNNVYSNTGNSYNMGINNGYNTMNMMESNNNSNSGGGKQTSFQRLCLHRLADRFKIIRQNNMNSNMNNNNNYINAGNANNGPGLIRLVKVKESRIPKVKLINVDMSTYETSNTIPQDRGTGTGGVGGDSFEGATNSFAAMGLTDRMTGANLDSSNCITGGGANSSSGKKSKKKEKVKIMKRSSNKGSTGSLNNDSRQNSGSRNKGKKLSDKEKAYAEARARIFNTQESNSTIDESDHANSSSANENKTTDTGNVATAFDDSTSTLQPTVSIESVGSPGRSSPSVFASQINAIESQQQPSLSLSNSSNDVAATDNSNNYNNNVPAAAIGGAESKVLWRNRQQESNDPDFRRAHHPVMMQQHVYTQAQYQPNGGMYGHGVGVPGYHYQGTDMDPMSYGRSNQQMYYQQQQQQQQHWQAGQQQDINNSMHQMYKSGGIGTNDNGQNRTSQYQQYAPSYYDAGVSNDGGNSNDKKQQTPVYTDEEFPALG